MSSRTHLWGKYVAKRGNDSKAKVKRHSKLILSVVLDESYYVLHAPVSSPSTHKNVSI